MRHLFVVALLSFTACASREEPSRETVASPSPSSAAKEANPMPNSVYDLTMNRLDGTAEKLDSYKGKVLLIVNTASECGFTPQYEGLEKLHEELSGKGLAVLGFPSNDFGAQEPGSASDIGAFCKKNYGVSFPMFDKVETKGPGATPLYKLLGEKAGEPKWNFHKYLVDRKGNVVKGFASNVAPESAELRDAITPLLDAQ